MFLNRAKSNNNSILQIFLGYTIELQQNDEVLFFKLLYNTEKDPNDGRR